MQLRVKKRRAPARAQVSSGDRPAPTEAEAETAAEMALLELL